MEYEDIKRYFRTFLVWLLPGLAAGFLIAVVVTFQEYKSFSRFAGAVIEQGIQDIKKGDLQGERDIKKRDTRGIAEDDQKAELKERFFYALKKSGSADQKAGESRLHEYGYHLWGRLGANTLYLSAICVLLSEFTGFWISRGRARERGKLERRIEELTKYLLAANRGEAGILRRREDIFSHLEDEIYKVVMELKSTKEDAVHNHEVLSERIADIAHQLKTPITSMSLMTELLEDQQTEDGKECLRRLTLQIHRLRNLVYALLSLAKLESHAIRYKSEKIEMEALIEGASEPLQELIRSRKIRLEVSGGPVSIETDRQWTEEAVLNVLKNCIEHSAPEGVIQIRWEENPLYTEIRFTDSGKGFAKKDLPHLFERFYKGENAQKDSAGIGLALAKLVAEQQNGHIYAENTIDGHASFILRFYRKAA